MRGVIALYQTVRTRGSLFGVKGIVVYDTSSSSRQASFNQPAFRPLDSAARQLSSRKPFDDDHSRGARKSAISKSLASYVRIGYTMSLDFMQGVVALFQTVRARGSSFGDKGALSSSSPPSFCSTKTSHQPASRPLDSASRKLSNRKPFGDNHSLGTRKLPIPKSLASHVRLPGIHDPEDYNPNSDFTVIFLGTGAGVPTPSRSASATALKTQHSTLLFDAGEGVGNQLMRSRISHKSVDKIFISHMHGDHIFGLPSLILTLQTALVQKLQIFGPVGIYNFLTSCLSFSYTKIQGKMTIEVYELQGGSRRWLHPAARRKYPEFQHQGIIRKSIPRNRDGTWTLCTATEVTDPDKILKRSESAGLHVTAAEIEHVPKLHCFGFVVEEARTLPRKIDPARALALGVEPGIKYQTLKYGFPVMSDDETREVRPEDVLLEGSVRPRKLVALGDCCHIPGPMARLCHDADVLIHEATLSEKDQGHKVDFGGHSSAAQAGRFGNMVSPAILAMNHLSASKISNMREHIQEAEKEITNGKTHVLATADLMEVSVPMAGFDLSKIDVEMSSGGRDEEEAAAQNV